MSSDLGKRFRDHIALVDTRLRGIPDGLANHETRPGGWRRKEVVGHLIDSALNNHQRFVRAALDGVYEGPPYDQEGWVGLHGYHDLPWRALLDHWREQNQLLARVVERIPDSRLLAACRVGTDPPVTLSFLISDYLRHLDHHLAQIASDQSAVGDAPRSG